jgi:hypothetical protein
MAEFIKLVTLRLPVDLATEAEKYASEDKVSLGKYCQLAVAAENADRKQRAETKAAKTRT